MDEFEKEEGGVTIGEIFRTIFSQKWLALIIVAAITVVGTLGLYFTNKLSEVYSVSFVLQLPNTGEATSTSYTYPDGDSFYFTDLISSENLKAVASREGFSDINIDKMVKKGDISIVRTIDKLDEESTEGVYDLNYTIKVKSKYFSDEDQARDFVEAITAFPREHVISMSIDYDYSLTSSKASITYEEQLADLKDQALYIQDKYEELVKSYGDEFVVQTGRTLASYMKEVDAYIEKDLFAALQARADKNGYIKSANAKYQYESQLQAIQHELELAENTRDELLKYADKGSVIYDEIITISKEIAELKQKEKFLNNYINALKNATQSYEDPIEDFIRELGELEATVTKFTEEIKPIASFIYGRVTKINYFSTKVVEVENTRGIVFSAAISLIVGIVVAAIVAYIVGRNKQKNAKAARTEKGSSYEEAHLQAAAADADDKKDEK